LATYPPSSNRSLPLLYYPTLTYPEGVSISRGNLVDVVTLPSCYFVHLDLLPTADGSTYRNIFQLTRLDGVISQLPAWSFCSSYDCGEETLGLVLSFKNASSSSQVSLYTTNLRLRQWSSVTITIDNEACVMTLSLTGGLRVPNMTTSIPHSDNGEGVEIFVSNPWDASASANIRNLHIGSASLPLSFYPKISGFNITSGNLVGVVALPAQGERERNQLRK
jgi:hypothetical protein